MKKLLIGLSLLLFTGCSNVTEKKLVLNSEDEFVYSTYSTIVLLSNINSSNVSNLNNSNTSSNVSYLTTTETTEVESNIKTFNEYYGMLKPFLDEGGKDIFTVTEVDSTHDEYAVEMEIKIKLSDRTETMTFLYNEDEEGNFFGEVILGEESYQLEGKNEVEEDESKLVARAYLDDNNFVNMILKTEENETKYEYEVALYLLI